MGPTTVVKMARVLIDRRNGVWIGGVRAGSVHRLPSRAWGYSLGLAGVSMGDYPTRAAAVRALVQAKEGR